MPRPTFAPPRAGALGGVWRAWYALRRRVGIRIPRAPLVLQGVGLGRQDLAVLLIPIYAWFALGRRTFARCAIGAYVAGVAISLLCVGWPSAGYASGVMFTLHGLGIAEYFYSGKLREKPPYRFARYGGVLLAVGLVYSLGSDRLFATFVLAVPTDRGVVVINTWTPPTSLQRDELVAFRTGGWRSGNVLTRAGIYAGRVCGLPGEVVKFRRDGFEVNGQVRHRLMGMPKGGELTVPVDRTLVWPFDLRREFGAGQDALGFAERVALVPASAVLGRPYARWFLRVQTPEPDRTP